MKAVLVISTACGLLAATLITAAAVVYSGAYNVAATRQHTQWVYSVLETTLRHSVQLRARDIQPPPLDDAQRILRGAACYRDKCVQCHGAPGVAQGDIGKSMQPLPGPLVDALQRWRTREIYWITRHGIKMSGMPAWEFRLDEDALWDVVAFVQRLPELTPEAYAAATQAEPQPVATTAPFSTPSSTPVSASAASCGQNVAPAPGPIEASARSYLIGDVERGRQALYQYACSACHTIPGIAGSFPHVGPPLQGLASRSLIAGRLPNTPDNMVQWLRHPKTVKPLTAMPDMGVTDAHARDMAAFLATLY